jgi:tRNA(Ile)-lysidine synthetase-like protein
VDLQREVVAFIHRERLLSPGDRVVVGVSGGPDSLALLHLVHACREQLGIEVHAAHLNHLIRGTEADQDAQFVADVASAWDIPCTVVARDVPAFARDHRLALEEAARRVRYAFLAEVAQSVGGSRIAVGHNADDQSETVLMHWLRGAGLAGLRGMLPATPLADLRLGVPTWIRRCTGTNCATSCCRSWNKSTSHIWQRSCAAARRCSAQTMTCCGNCASVRGRISCARHRARRWCSIDPPGQACTCRCSAPLCAGR